MKTALLILLLSLAAFAEGDEKKSIPLPPGEVHLKLENSMLRIQNIRLQIQALQRDDVDAQREALSIVDAQRKALEVPDGWGFNFATLAFESGK